MGAGFNGLTFQFKEPQPTTPGRVAGFSGLFFTIVPKTLTVQVLKLVGKAFEPVRDMSFDIKLESVTERITTNAAGKASIDFPDPYIEVWPVAGSAPGGYRYDTVTPIKTLARNTLTITLIPDSLERYYTSWEIL